MGGILYDTLGMGTVDERNFPHTEREIANFINDVHTFAEDARTAGIGIDLERAEQENPLEQEAAEYEKELTGRLNASLAGRLLTGSRKGGPPADTTNVCP